MSPDNNQLPSVQPEEPVQSQPVQPNPIPPPPSPEPQYRQPAYTPPPSSPPPTPAQYLPPVETPPVVPPAQDQPPQPNLVQAPQPTVSTQPEAQTLEQLEPGETVIAEIHRHFFGIFYIYVLTTVALAVGIGLIYYLLPNFVDTSQTDVYKIIGSGAGVLVVLMVLIMVLATHIYYSSRLILTNRNITQIIRVGLLNKKISQLDVGNIEDVNAVRKGFFATILNYGSLNIETAGEVENFTFNYCPNPDHYAKQILEARQQVRASRRDVRN